LEPNKGGMLKTIFFSEKLLALKEEEGARERKRDLYERTNNN